MGDADLGASKALVREPDRLHHGARHGAIRPLEKLAAPVSWIDGHCWSPKIDVASVRA
jgi:hypothetical protein